MKRLIIAIAAVVLVVEAAGQAGQRQSLAAAVRAAVAEQDFAGGEQIVSSHRSANGETPELLEALSWLGRGALAANQLTAAEKYASARLPVRQRL